jgi:hypothetical protein
MSSARKQPPRRSRPRKNTGAALKATSAAGGDLKTILAAPVQTVIPDNPQLPESIAMTDIQTRKPPRQLSSKVIVGTKIGAIKEETKLYSIVGIANGFKTGESAYGPWIAFKGNFEATRFSDGQTFKAPLAILPTEATGLVRAELDRTGGTVEFAYRISAKPSTVPGATYTYHVDEVVPAGVSDPLAALRNALA